MVLKENNQSVNTTENVYEKEEGKIQQSFKKISKLIVKNWFLLFIWIIALMLRIIVAIYSKGYIHPDEHYQSIEIVWEKLFGYGVIPWEFEEGARSWVYPGIVLMIFKLAIAFGASTIEEFILATRIISGVTSMISVITAYYFGKKVYNRKVGLAATSLIGVWYSFLFWGTRTMADGFAMNFTFLASYFIFDIILGKKKKIDRKNNQEKKEIIVTEEDKKFSKINVYLRKFNCDYRSLLKSSIAGLFIGFSFMLKFNTAVLAVPLALVLLFKKKWGDFLAFFVGSLIMILVQGIIDLYTWGGFLHSVIEFIKYNIITGQSAYHGTHPFYAYVGFFIIEFGPFSILLLIFIYLGCKNNRKSWYLISISFVYILIFSFIGHKEFRFILPSIPLLILLAAKGLIFYPEFIKQYNHKKIVYFLISIIIIFSSIMNSFFIQTYTPNQAYCKAFQWVGQQEDIEVVIVVDETIFYSPGYAYLEKKIVLKQSSYLVLDSVLESYQLNETYVVIEGNYLVLHSEINNTLQNTNYSLSKTFESTNPFYDSTIWIYHKIILS
jgi:4-amino-4-deoxy-L-arabinose transferase-like glycosyltransferase